MDDTRLKSLLTQEDDEHLSYADEGEGYLEEEENSEMAARAIRACIDYLVIDAVRHDFMDVAEHLVATRDSLDRQLALLVQTHGSILN